MSLRESFVFLILEAKKTLGRGTFFIYTIPPTLMCMSSHPCECCYPQRPEEDFRLPEFEL